MKKVIKNLLITLFFSVLYYFFLFEDIKLLLAVAIFLFIMCTLLDVIDTMWEKQKKEDELFQKRISALKDSYDELKRERKR